MGFINITHGKWALTLMIFQSQLIDLMVAFTYLKMKPDSFNYKDDLEELPMGSGKFIKTGFDFIYFLSVLQINKAFRNLIDAGKENEFNKWRKRLP